MKVEVSASDIEERTADGRGRITIGSEYADKIVTVAVLDVDEEGSDE